ncbi:MAG: hypothetical protein ACRCSP_01280 [Rhodoglobus sp.]
MSTMVHEQRALFAVRSMNSVQDVAEGTRQAEDNLRAQGWAILVIASTVLWIGIIVAVVGIAGLAQ